MADADADLLALIRASAEELDPPSSDLADRMIARIAVKDLSREYALLTLIDSASSAVRSDGETTTLQFSDGSSSILLHVMRAARDLRRIDGWVDAGAVEVRLDQGSRTWTAVPDAQGRFAFGGIPPGLSSVRLVTAGDRQDLLTPQFEV